MILKKINIFEIDYIQLISHVKFYLSFQFEDENTDPKDERCPSSPDEVLSSLFYSLLSSNIL